MTDFNKFTTADEDAAKNKFLTYGRGLVMGQYLGVDSVNDEAQWHDLINPQKYSEQTLIRKATNIGVKMNSHVDDEFIGANNILFKHTDEYDNEVEFSYTEAYLFLRGVIRHRRDSSEYKQKKIEKERILAQLETIKTKSERKRELKAQLEKLKETI